MQPFFLQVGASGPNALYTLLSGPLFHGITILPEGRAQLAIPLS
jgi:hypothetical protein